MGDESCSSSAESELEFDSADDELLHCSRNGDVARIRQLLERKDGDDDVDVNCKGSQKANRGWTPLHLAAYFGHDEVVKLLLEHGSEVNAINGTGDTSLHKAALTNREAVVTVLLQHEADVSIVNCEGHTAKQLASSDDVIRLIEAAENHESKKLEQEFLEAAAAGQTDQLEKLLQREKPPSLTCSDSYGNTALHISALRGKENVIVFLLQHGVNTNMKNNNGQTAADMTQVHQIKQLLGVEPRQAFQIQPQKIEGQLLKKSRIFGFRPVWAVLDKGVLSYYENRGNAVTGRKRKGMKYLDEAKVFVSNKDGLDFKISFSDGTSHILSIDPVNGAEVTKQKWLNALKEHIEYSTHYIHSCEAVSEYDSDKVSLGTLHDALKTAEAHQQLLTEKITKISESLQQSNDASPAKPNLIQKGLESVLESSKDVCESLNQCMILFQQQEELRELELKEEREKCRVLQDSLHALATEHHELERSISTRRLSRTYDTEDDEFYDCDKDDDDEEDGVVQRLGSPDTFKSFQESFADAISLSISDSSFSAG